MVTRVAPHRDLLLRRPVRNWLTLPGPCLSTMITLFSAVGRSRGRRSSIVYSVATLPRSPCFSSPGRKQTFRFEEQQNLRFEVYDVDTAYNSADATRIDPAKQVRSHEVFVYRLCSWRVRLEASPLDALSCPGEAFQSRIYW